jgi:hypothetical protein
MRGCFCEKTVAPKSRFAKKSFRWIKSGRSWVLIGCPKGKFRRGRCTVGTRAHKVMAAGRSCRVREHRVCK